MIHYLEQKLEFPNPELSDEEGLLAIGGDLKPDRLIMAYEAGIFPWYNDGPILWWSPDPRCVLFPEKFKVSKNFKTIINKDTFTIKIDHDFEKVITYCAETKRPGQDGTWITNDMKKSYIRLHKLGYCHSFETYKDNKLVGGLYGVSLGKAFFGESMFHLESNASKFALYHLVQYALAKGFIFIDNQTTTNHLLSLGAEEISRKKFIHLLTISNRYKSIRGKWLF